MNILFLSKYGEGLDIAFRMVLDGNKVRCFIEEPSCKEIGDGLVTKINDWRSSVSWADIVFFDQNSKGLSRIWEQIRKQVPCFGGSSFGCKLEEDRHFARSIMERVGFPLLESKSFKSLKEVIPHLKEHKVPHVIKPSGKMVEKHHLIVGERDDNADTISQVERLIEQKLMVDSVEIEEKKKGVEVGLSGWFNGLNWIGPIGINFEHKRSHDKEIGYLTGEMGTLMKYVEDPDLPLFKETLDKVRPILRASDYRGQIDINLIVGRDQETNERFVAPLEFTPRIGYPSLALEDELHITPWADLAMACATGKDSDIRVRYDWAVGVVLAAFGFPFDDKVSKISKGLIVEGLNEHTLDHIHPMNLSINRQGKFVVSQGAGYLLVATGRGESIPLAKERAYEEMSAINVPNSFYRHDVSDKISTYELDELRILPLEESRV